MTMNGVAFDEAFGGDPHEALDRAAGHLVKLGYSLVDRSAHRVHLRFAGRWFTTDPEEQTHHAYVSIHEGALRFEFTTGIVASYWTEADRAMAQERAEGAARAARGGQGLYRDGGEDPPMVACAYCGKINVTSAPRCSVCGATRRA